MGQYNSKRSQKRSNEAEDAGAKLKALLAAVPAGEEVVLSAELAELLRWRVVTWNKLPKPVVPLVLPFLTVQETLGLNSSIGERRGERARPLAEGIQAPTLPWLRRVGLQGYEGGRICRCAVGERQRHQLAESEA